MKTKYPFQIESIIHKSAKAYKTFGMDARLFSPQEETEGREPSAPLEMHEGYSVFRGTLIHKEGTEKKYVSFNIPAEEVPYIHKKTEMAISIAMNEKIATSTCPGSNSGKAGFAPKTVLETGTESTPAYTVKISSGVLKGKTPAQVLLESDANLSSLEKQSGWLKENLAKYPRNQIQIDAIEDAISLHKAGKLIKSDAVPASSVAIEIYSCPPKNVKPLDEKGRFTVYDVSIIYDSSRGLPITITVNNCFAPVNTEKGNEIEMSKAVDKKTVSMALSENEWFTMIDKMKAQKIMFESLSYPEQLKLAAKISKENYDASAT